MKYSTPRWSTVKINKNVVKKDVSKSICDEENNFFLNEGGV